MGLMILVYLSLLKMVATVWVRMELIMMDVLWLPLLFQLDAKIHET